MGLASRVTDAVIASVAVIVVAVSCMLNAGIAPSPQMAMTAMLLRLLFLWLAVAAAGTTHTFHFNASWVERNPDGVHPRRVIALSDEWPLPTIHVRQDDRVVIHLTNLLEPGLNTSLHFHGLFQQGQMAMDGPEMVSQCPIPYGHTLTYNFTIIDQLGTYWYHLHLGSQYSDGMRGMLIIEPRTAPEHYAYDEMVPLLVADWYHQDSRAIMRLFLSRFNPTGAEPIPQNSLFNETRNGTWTVQPGRTYLLRLVNMGMFVPQFVFIEGHSMVVVEVDGVDVEPYEVDLLRILVAQRYAVLVRTKAHPPRRHWRLVQMIDRDMLDWLPADLELVSTNWLSYAGAGDDASPPPYATADYDALLALIDPLDDFLLTPFPPKPLFDAPDYQIVLNFTMQNLGDGVQYALFNNITYTPPKVPTLYSVLLAASDELAQNSLVYGTNTNTFVLQKDEIVEIVINNQDPGDHPFHLHGHIFQVVSRLPAGDDDDNPITFDPTNPAHTQYPESPVQRDTVVVNSNGFVVLRFRADNPGVWFLHCHVDWHLEQGLAIVLVEQPAAIRQRQTVPPDHLAACAAGGVPTRGNAAANDANWLDLAGQNAQHAPLPPGFTAKGYVALAVSTLLGVYGLFLIYRYGMEDVRVDNSEAMVQKLRLLAG